MGFMKFHYYNIVNILYFVLLLITIINRFLFFYFLYKKKNMSYNLKTILNYIIKRL